MSLVGTFTGVLNGVAHGDPLSGVASSATNSLAGVGLRAISSWVLGGTQSALEAVARVIGTATAPNLTSTWFSATYWRVAALAAVLTMPFLFAAAIQALVRSDLALLTRATFGYLPLSLLGVSVAAPVTMLLLSATDQMSAVVGAAGTQGGARFLDRAAATAVTSSAVDGSPFFAVVIGVCAVMAALALVLELLVREAAVYVVVLMLPLAFAAMVWPARRIWSIRLTELLVSLILSKFVIVAVLTLAGAAFANGTPGVSELLVAMALVMLSVFAPWTLLRILPFTELAASAAGAMRHEVPTSADPGQRLMGAAQGLGNAAETLPHRLRQFAGANNSEGLSTFAPRPPMGDAARDSASEPSDSKMPASIVAESPVRNAAPDSPSGSAQQPGLGSPSPSSGPELSKPEKGMTSAAATPEPSGQAADRRAPLDRPWARGNTETPLALGPDFVEHGFDATSRQQTSTASGDGGPVADEPSIEAAKPAIDAEEHVDAQPGAEDSR